MLWHFLAAHWKIQATIAGIVGGIGLLANEVTAPKVLAVMVFLSDWNMAGTWEWSIRTGVYVVVGSLIYWHQKIKHDRELLSLRRELEHERGERKRLSSSNTDLLKIAASLLPREKLLPP